MIFTIIPFYIMIVGSFKPAVSLVSIPIDLNPFSNLTIRNIITVLQKSEIFIWLKNSFIISLLGALITSFVSITAGYSFARINFRFKNFLFFLVMATLMMPKQVLLIPNFLVANQLHLVNTMLGVIITSIAPASGVFLCRQFISSIPRDLFEAAEIDGCGELRKFYLVNIPTNNWNVSESVFTLRANNKISKELLYLILLSDNVQKYCDQHAHGVAQRGIRMADLKAFTMGANVVTSYKNKKFCAMTCAWAMMCDYDKLMMLLGNQSDTGRQIKKGDIIGVSALSKGQATIAKHFGDNHSLSFPNLINII